MNLITLKYLTLHNFMSYKGDCELDFHGKDIVGILAEYEDDVTRSNRAGKCFGRGTPILMYDGTTKSVEDIKSGELLLGPDSKPRVVGATTSGTEEMFLIESNDGSMRFKCNAPHVLVLKASRNLLIHGKTVLKDEVVTITVGDFLVLPVWKQKMLNIFRSGGSQFKEVPLPLDPYVLGVWLGDGMSDSSKVTVSNIEVKNYLEGFSKKYETKFIPKELIGKNGKPYWKIALTGTAKGHGKNKYSTSVMSTVLKDLKLLNNKHVPDVYLRSSYEQRLQLLAGLIDTDGYLAKNRYYEVVTKFTELKDNIVWLCRSLGLAVSVKPKEGKIGGVKVGDYFRINIYGDIFKIPCKVERKRTDFKTTKKDVLRKGFTVTPVGAGDYYGFSVDKDNMFLLGDFTVVHNSTLIEAIGYNLTGLSRAKSDEKLIHHGEKEMWVEATYTDGERDYTIKRGRDFKGKGILELDWVQKVSEVEEEIERLFGITPKDFHYTSYFKQADTEGFMKMKPSEKAHFLMQWIDNAHWKEKEEKANEDRKVVKQKLRDNENLKKALEASLEVDESLESIIYDLKKENKELDANRATLTERLGVVNNTLADIQKTKDTASNEVRKLKKEKQELEMSLENFEEDTKLYNKCRAEYAQLKKQLEELDTPMGLAEANKQLDTLKIRKSEIQKTLRIAKENSSGICPVLNQSCDRLEFNPSELDSLNRALAGVGEKMSELSVVIEAHASKTTLKNKMDVVQEKGKRVKERLLKKPDIEKRLSEIETELPKVIANYESIDHASLLKDKGIITEEINELKNKIKENENVIFDHELRISEAKKAKEKIDLVVESNEKLQNDLALLNYTCYAFKTIPALEVENSFQEIEDNINWILDEILNGVTVSFSPDRELKALEPMCGCGFQFPKGFRGYNCIECDTPRQKQRKEEVTFRVLENGIEQDFEMDSGGGRQVISYAVRIALTMLKRAQRKCNLNILFLDEVDSALDPFLATQIIGSVTNFLTKKLGYEQVILVSHKEQIKSAVPHIIKVTKKDVYSTARFV